MWIDRRKKHYVPLKLDEYELMIVDMVAEEQGVSRGEAIRRLIWTSRILLDPDLKLGDMVKEKNWNKSLVDLIKPLPELASLANVELKLWRGYVRKSRSSTSRA